MFIFCCANLVANVYFFADCFLVGPLIQLMHALTRLLLSVSKRGVRAAVFDGIAAHMTYNPDEFKDIGATKPIVPLNM